jgi:hypothetical protein
MRQRYRSPVAACLLALVFAASCRTFHVRDVQRQFNAAVAADNSQAAQGLGPIGAMQLYEDVRAELPDATIAKLPARLQATAYAMRAVSEWRSGALVAARDSAARGLALPDVANNPRDRVMMQLIDPLVILDDVQGKFRKAGETVTLATYQRDYAADLKTAWNALGNLLASPDPALPRTSATTCAFSAGVSCSSGESSSPASRTTTTSAARWRRRRVSSAATSRTPCSRRATTCRRAIPSASRWTRSAEVTRLEPGRWQPPPCGGNPADR